MECLRRDPEIHSSLARDREEKEEQISSEKGNPSVGLPALGLDAILPVRILENQIWKAKSRIGSQAPGWRMDHGSTLSEGSD